MRHEYTADVTRPREAQMSLLTVRSLLDKQRTAPESFLWDSLVHSLINHFRHTKKLRHIHGRKDP